MTVLTALITNGNTHVNLHTFCNKNKKLSFKKNYVAKKLQAKNNEVGFII